MFSHWLWSLQMGLFSCWVQTSLQGLGELQQQWLYLQGGNLLQKWVSRLLITKCLGCLKEGTQRMWGWYSQGAAWDFGAV